MTNKEIIWLCSVILFLGLIGIGVWQLQLQINREAKDKESAAAIKAKSEEYKPMPIPKPDTLKFELLSASFDVQGKDPRVAVRGEGRTYMIRPQFVFYITDKKLKQPTAYLFDMHSNHSIIRGACDCVVAELRFPNKSMIDQYVKYSR